MASPAYFEKCADGSLVFRQASSPKKTPNSEEVVKLKARTPAYFEKRADGTLQKQVVPVSPSPRNSMFERPQDIKVLFAPTPDADKRFYRRVDGELLMFNQLPQNLAVDEGKQAQTSFGSKINEHEHQLLPPPRMAPFPALTTWECVACTFLNDKGSACEMCGTDTGRTDNTNDSDNFTESNHAASIDSDSEDDGSDDGCKLVERRQTPNQRDQKGRANKQKNLSRSSSWADVAPSFSRRHSNRVAPEELYGPSLYFS
jgi:hypothetical protein